MECPECGLDCEYIEAEPDIGIRGGYSCDCGWASDECDPDTDDPDDDDR